MSSTQQDIKAVKCETGMVQIWDMAGLGLWSLLELEEMP